MNCVAVIVESRDLPGLDKVIAAHEKLLPDDWECWVIKNESINSMHDYNRLLTSKRFWRNMPDKVLIFQHDSMLLRPGVEDFLEWDFCGAPIPKIGWPAMNGGLSIRDSKAMLKVINNIPYEGMSVSGNEDIYFCNGLRQLSGWLPSKEEAQKFSIETEFVLGSVGYHQIDRYLSPTECNLVRNQYNDWKL